MSEQTRVAIIGAGRIGKQHAKWYQALGCEVVGFLGSTAESVARSAPALAAVLGRHVPGYTEFGRLVEEGRPALASVCTPHARHCEHTLQAVAAGLHVLCEKPLAWDDARTPAQMLADAARMVSAAEKRGVLLGMNAQYVTAAPLYRGWYEAERGPLRHAECIEVVLQSRGRGGTAEYGQIWTDLSSHALGLVLKWAPGGRLDPDRARLTLRRKEVVAEFTCLVPGGRSAQCRIHLANIPEGAIRRAFGVNGFLLEYAGRNNAEGVFRTYLRRGEEERDYPDLMCLAIEQFVRATRGEAPVPVPAAEGYRNLEMQLGLLDAGVME